MKLAILWVAGSILATNSLAAPATLRLPLAFEPAGQGRFQAFGRGLSVTAGPEGLTFRGRKVEWQMQLVGQRSSRWAAEDPLPGIVSHFHGRDPSQWRVGLPTSRTVRLAEAYPGVDMLLHGAGGSLEYDFLVQPGADPRKIRLRLPGARLIVTATGDLRCGAALHRRPEIYQETGTGRQVVRGGFRLFGDGTVGFQVGRYDRSLPLTIDPTVVYESYYGGSGEEEAQSVGVDNGGNAYFTGYTTSGGAGDADIFVVKVNPAGNTAIYTVTVGGSGDDYGNGIAIDGAGNAVITGNTDSRDFPVSAGAFQPNTYGGLDAFLFRLDPTGVAISFSTYFGGSADDKAYGVALDGSGNAYLTGVTTSNDFPVTKTAFQRTRVGGVDAFVAKFSSSGNLTYSTYLGGSGNDEGFAIAVDRSGNAYVTGDTDSDDFPVTTGIYQGKRAGKLDLFVTRVNAGGTALVASTYVGGSDDDIGYGLALDAAGAVYLAGSTASVNFPVTSNAPQPGYVGGDTDGMILKMSSDLKSLVYATFIGTQGADSANSVAVNLQNEVFVAGDSDADGFPVTADAVQARRAANRDATLVWLSADGSKLRYGSYWGGSGDDIAFGVAQDRNGNVYVAGSTSSLDLPVTSKAFQGAFGGGSSDAMIGVFKFPLPQPVVNPGGVVNAASSVAALAPGELISIYGFALANTTGSTSAVPLPGSLGGTQVKVNGVVAPLLYVSPGQLNAQLPYATKTGTASLIVTTGGGASTAAAITVSTTAPGVFVRGTHAIAQNSDNSTNSSQKPAKAGDLLVVYFTGLGPIDQTVATGAAAGSNPVVNGTAGCKATIAGVTASVLFCGLTPGFVGLGQINLMTSASTPAGEQPLVITVGSANSNSSLVSIIK